VYHNDQLTDEAMGYICRASEEIPGWTRGEEAIELINCSFRLRNDAVIVEIGSFLGSSAVLLAAARQLRGSGKVHCIDPFDCSGDAFSIPYYQRILAAAGGGQLRDHFERFIQKAGLRSWVEVHQGTARAIAANWKMPIDMLYLDGDQSRSGAREAYDSWSQFLKNGGTIAVHNTDPANHTEGHDGHRYLAETQICSPFYSNIRRIRATTFARKEVG
jgi:predicted O-methyltransferase YrrM